jgi:hypothetical protein
MTGGNLANWLALAIAAGLASANQRALAQEPPVRRAVVVGIDRYRAAVALPPVVPPTGRILPKGRTSQRNWSDLDGAVNDAEAMKALLIGRFGFAANQIVLLENDAATAGAILGAIQRHLIAEARPGDISLFFYAGHGSQIRNTRTTEQSGLDQTIVPADAPRGTPDIRDKELARLFRQGIAKGVRLTAIFDSCHAGSIARGSWNRGAKARNLEPDSGYVEDAPDLDASGKPLLSPEASGMLVLSAAQDFQTASETGTESGPHGLFTWSLLKVLRTVPPNERIDRVFQRIRAMMQCEGTLQEPVLAGRGRAELSLLGLEPDSANVLTAAAERAWDNRVRLQAGAGVGLNEGCQLRKIDAGGKPAGTRIRVEKVLGLNSSEAVVLDSPAEIHEGDLFQMVRWTAPDSAALRVFIPQTAATREQLTHLGDRLSALRSRVHWVDDPTVESPTHVMSWSGKSWILEQNPTSRKPVDLGEKPAPAAVAKALPEGARFMLLLPAPQSLTAEIRLGTGSPNDAIVVEKSPARANYALYGRYDGKAITYAWVLPDVTEAALAERFATQERGAPVPAMAMPIRSDWLTRAADLTEAAVKLGRIHGWLQLDAPADAGRFPYHLALRERNGDSALITGGTVHEGQGLELVLVADRERLREAVAADALTPRWVYVFSINRNGKSELLFPGEGQGNVENRLPVLTAGSTPPPMIRLPGDLDIIEPFGIDAYFLVASEEPLPSPEVLKFDGVRTRGAMSDPLSRLLARTGVSQRGTPPAVPMNWSIERLVLRSVGRGEHDAKRE